MYDPRESEDQKRHRIARDLHDLRCLAWLVQRGRYNREPRQTTGGRRGRARITTFTFYAEPADLIDAEQAVRRMREEERGQD